MKYAGFIFSLLIFTLSAQAADRINVQKDFQTLGDNQQITTRAKALDPENRVRIVQNRAVDMNNRFEFGFNYGLVGGGDSYYRTQLFGGNFDYHLNSRWSFGLRYYHSYNTATAEGQDVYNAAKASPDSYHINSYDFPIDTALVVVNFYPIYGKLNFLDLGVSHFDVYLLAGYGKTILNSGASDTYTGGGGLGFWWSQHFASRLEARYQTYQDQVVTGSRQINEVIGMASIGILL